MMRTIVFFLLVMLPVFDLFSQDLDELDRRNGFKDIKLGSKVKDYDDLVYVEDIDAENTPNLKLYKRKEGSYTSIGSIPINEVAVTAYDGYVWKINVLVEKDEDLLKGLRKAFGPPKIPLNRTSYEWRTDKLYLVYSSASKNEIEMYYHSNEISDLIKEDRSKRIEDLSNDF